MKVEDSKEEGLKWKKSKPGRKSRGQDILIFSKMLDPIFPTMQLDLSVHLSLSL